MAFALKPSVAAKKNSLVGNINRRKRAGKSRPKSRSTISPSAYDDMQKGWPRKKKAKRKGKRGAGKLGKKRGAARERAGKTRSRSS